MVANIASLWIAPASLFLLEEKFHLQSELTEALKFVEPVESREQLFMLQFLLRKMCSIHFPMIRA